MDAKNIRQRREIYYSGMVHGVGFRFTTSRISRRFLVTGYVQNLSDGRVLLVAEGGQDDLDHFLTAVVPKWLVTLILRRCPRACTLIYASLPGNAVYGAELGYAEVLTARGWKRHPLTPKEHFAVFTRIC